jgi:hypothetical protein
MLIALPDIFRGIGVNPLQPGNTGLLLWMLMGYLVVTGVLVVSFGRLGDMFGRVRMYNLGFALFAGFSILRPRRGAAVRTQSRPDRAGRASGGRRPDRRSPAGVDHVRRPARV